MPTSSPQRSPVGLPLVRVGCGARTLVVLPGMALDTPPTSGVVARLYAAGFRRLARDHTVYVVHRPAGLAPGTGTRELAAAYAEALRAGPGRVDLMGLSTGGLIAQHLAAEHPDLVERLALVVSGARLAPAGRRICARWQALAEAGKWRRLRGDLTASAVDGAVLQSVARLAGALGGAPSARAAADFRTTVDAVLAHDTRAALAGVTVPTLVLGGATDPFFPEESLRATAAALPHATLRVLPSGHGLPKQRPGRMQREVAAFLAR